MTIGFGPPRHSPDTAALIIARRLDKWFSFSSPRRGLDAMTPEQMAPMVKRMIENNWDELAPAAHVIHDADVKRQKEEATKQAIENDYKVKDFSGWM